MRGRSQTMDFTAGPGLRPDSPADTEAVSWTCHNPSSRPWPWAGGSRPPSPSFPLFPPPPPPPPAGGGGGGGPPPPPPPSPPPRRRGLVGGPPPTSAGGVSREGR